MVAVTAARCSNAIHVYNAAWLDNLQPGTADVNKVMCLWVMVEGSISASAYSFFLTELLGHKLLSTS